VYLIGIGIYIMKARGENNKLDKDWKKFEELLLSVYAK